MNKIDLLDRAATLIATIDDGAAHGWLEAYQLLKNGPKAIKYPKLRDVWWHVQLLRSESVGSLDKHDIIKLPLKEVLLQLRRNGTRTEPLDLVSNIGTNDHVSTAVRIFFSVGGEDQWLDDKPPESTSSTINTEKPTPI